jgi:hypothetical protein
MFPRVCRLPLRLVLLRTYRRAHWTCGDQNAEGDDGAQALAEEVGVADEKAFSNAFSINAAVCRCRHNVPVIFGDRSLFRCVTRNLPSDLFFVSV